MKMESVAKIYVTMQQQPLHQEIVQLTMTACHNMTRILMDIGVHKLIRVPIVIIWMDYAAVISNIFQPQQRNALNTPPHATKTHSPRNASKPP